MAMLRGYALALALELALAVAFAVAVAWVGAELRDEIKA